MRPSNEGIGSRVLFFLHTNDVSNVRNETIEVEDTEEGKIFIWPLRLFDGIVRWIDLWLVASFWECSCDVVGHAFKLKHNSLLLFYDSSLLKWQQQKKPNSTSG